jgi:hypothetical protein
MYSASDRWLVGWSFAWLVELGHRGIGEVAAGDGPFVVMVGEPAPIN